MITEDPGRAENPEPDAMHRLVARHLRKLGLTAEAPPSLAQWNLFLGRVSAAYADSDQQRYLIERSTRIASQEMSELHRQLREQAETDILTGLANRRSIVSKLTDRLAAHESADQTGLLFIDLDEFKQINDTLGHSVGDQVLVIAANRLRSVLQGSKAAGRLSGDEFVVIAPGECMAKASETAAEIVDAFTSPIIIAGQILRISASIGIAVAEGPGNLTGDLLRAADTAMYQSKRARGRRHTQAELSQRL
jgi:diguanylate cyclase (GGDEF)-like protein